MTLYKNSRGKLVDEKIPQAKLAAHQVLEIRHLARCFSKKTLATEYGISLCHVYRILNGDSWQHLKQVGHD